MEDLNTKYKLEEKFYKKFKDNPKNKEQIVKIIVYGKNRAKTSIKVMNKIIGITDETEQRRFMDTLKNIDLSIKQKFIDKIESDIIIENNSRNIIIAALDKFINEEGGDIYQFRETLQNM